MPFPHILRVFRPRGWCCLYEGKLSPLEGMVTLMIYLIINQYYLGYLLIFTGANPGRGAVSVNGTGELHSLSLNLVVRLSIESLFLRRLILYGQEALGLIIGEAFQEVFGIHSFLPKSCMKVYFPHVFMLLLWLLPASLASNLDWVI